ncbi:MAG: RagB/SusD family nutrient uptake outer membrane protein [Paludibacteraceae bacterium]|nr:RagB/SusD family nutrient uptake outer membrane protein [Paludibacteraceae bacterium]
MNSAINKLKILTATFVMLSLAACSEWLDIRPENEVVLEDYWQTESQATSVLASCYRGLSLQPCIERMIVWGELRSDNLVAGNALRVNLLHVIDVNITPVNEYAEWGSFYSVINYCNTFLHYAPEVMQRDPNFSQTKYRTMQAEALTLRALSYFYLVRAFREVPLVLEPSINDVQDYNISKSSERDIIDQIILDLLEARSYARADYGVGAYNKGRVTLNAINAILADVYLWDQQFALCVDACDRIIESRKVHLTSMDKVLNQIFYEGNSTESIFELQFDEEVQYNTAVDLLYGFEQSMGELSFPLYLVKEGTYSPFNFAGTPVKESVKDARYQQFFGVTANGSGYPVYKYALVQCTENADETVTPRYRIPSTTVNWVLYRLADVFLMKAEALVQLDRNEVDMREALRLVNETYMRANSTADSLQMVNYPNKTDMEKLVLRERQRELMFEGKRWFDLMRMVRRSNDPTSLLPYISPKLTGDNMQIKKMSVMNALYMPVHKNELEINTNLVQNPFYEDSEFMK